MPHRKIEQNNIVVGDGDIFVSILYLPFDLSCPILVAVMCVSRYKLVLVRIQLHQRTLILFATNNRNGKLDSVHFTRFWIVFQFPNKIISSRPHTSSDATILFIRLELFVPRFFLPFLPLGRCYWQQNKNIFPTACARFCMCVRISVYSKRNRKILNTGVL